MTKREIKQQIKELDSDLQHYVIAGNKAKAMEVRIQLAALNLQLIQHKGK